MAEERSINCYYINAAIMRLTAIYLSLDNHPISAHLMGLLFQLDGKQLQDQYKHHLGDFHDRDQKPHAEYLTVFPNNISPQLGINASAESFNAKLKAFRSVFRGVRDTAFFLRSEERRVGKERRSRGSRNN